MTNRSTVFVSQELANKLLAKHATPLYVYSKAYLNERADRLFGLCRPHNINIRYAVKANSHPEIIKLLAARGMNFDASSEYEAIELIEQGVKPEQISLSSQQPPRDLRSLLESGVKFVATSLHQLELVSQSGWRGKLAVRINPNVGSGHNNRTTTAGATASFGIWHEYLPDVAAWQKKSGCVIDRLHIHGGSGGDPKLWAGFVKSGFDLVAKLPSVTVMDLGGGFKIARMPDEHEADMAAIIQEFASDTEDFRNRTGRNIKLEIEPGSWLVGNAGVLLASIEDIVDTGKDGHEFIKLDTGMNDLLRPAMYGAQHEIKILNEASRQKLYVVVGHNCETSDILTPAPGDPESIKPRLLNEAKMGDLVCIGGAGAYCASMRAIGYNSFPSAREIFI